MVRKVLLLWMRVEHGVPPCILTLRRRRTEPGREMRLLQPRWHTSKKGSSRKKRFCAGSLMRLRSYRGSALRPAFSPLLKLKSGLQSVLLNLRQLLSRIFCDYFFHGNRTTGCLSCLSCLLAQSPYMDPLLRTKSPYMDRVCTPPNL